MPNKCTHHPPEFRQRMIELVNSGDPFDPAYPEGRVFGTTGFEVWSANRAG